MSSQTETERVPQQEQLGQGDIVRIEWADDQPGPTLGIVINADCDLAHGKTDGVVALVPVYPFEQYLAHFWAPGYVDDVVGTTTQAALALVDDTDGPALHDWVREAGAESVATILSERIRLKKPASEKLHSELRKLAVCLEAGKPSIDRFGSLCRLAPNPAGYARTQITAAKKALGEGHFFISDLVDHPSVGFVVRMRRLYVLPESDVFASTSSQRAGSNGDRTTAVRVARLSALYRFKVLQVFAQQYLRIGLPDEISALGALAIDDLVATYSGALP